VNEMQNLAAAPYSFFQGVDAVVIFITVLSYWITKYVKIKAKFLVPLLLSILCATALYWGQPIPEITNKAITYAGASMVLWEIYKNTLRKDKNK